MGEALGEALGGKWEHWGSLEGLGAGDTWGCLGMLGDTWRHLGMLGGGLGTLGDPWGLLGTLRGRLWKVIFNLTWDRQTDGRTDDQRSICSLFEALLPKA